MRIIFFELRCFVTLGFDLIFINGWCSKSVMALELALQALTGLTVLLVVGLVLTIFAKRMGISSLFLLLLGGFILAILQSKGLITLVFSDVLLVSLALLALQVLFDLVSMACNCHSVAQTSRSI